MRIMVRVRLSDDANGKLPKEIHIPLVAFRGALDTNGFWANAACYQVPVSVDTMYTIRVLDGRLVFRYRSSDPQDSFVGNITGVEVTQHNVQQLNSSHARINLTTRDLSPDQWPAYAKDTVHGLLEQHWFIDGFFEYSTKNPNYHVPQILYALLCALDKHTQSETTGATP